MPIELTPFIAELLDHALTDETPCLLATATSDGNPQVSPKGSFAVYDAQTLCFWDRSVRTSLQRMRENPQVVVYYRNIARVKDPANGALRFHGRARIVDDAATRERVWEKTIAAERNRDPEKKGVAVLIAVDLVDDLYGKPIMSSENSSQGARDAFAAYRLMYEKIPESLRDGHHRRVGYLISSLPAVLPAPIEAARRDILGDFEEYCAGQARHEGPELAALWKGILAKIDHMLDLAAQ